LNLSCSQPTARALREREEVERQATQDRKSGTRLTRTRIQDSAHAWQVLKPTVEQMSDGRGRRECSGGGGGDGGGERCW
jgi:hypothetical protein